MPALKFVPLDDYYNSVAVVLRGLEPQYSGMKDGDMAMVSYEELMTDSRIAGLVTFVRRHFGGQLEAITAQDVKTIRIALEKADLPRRSTKQQSALSVRSPCDEVCR